MRTGVFQRAEKRVADQLEEDFKKVRSKSMQAMNESVQRISSKYEAQTLGLTSQLLGLWRKKPVDQDKKRPQDHEFLKAIRRGRGMRRNQKVSNQRRAVDQTSE
jgi:uncharacterized protein (DUF2267 family)